MITKFKLYESVNKGEPEVNDYVICGPNHYLFDPANPAFKKFITNSIGLIWKHPSKNIYIVKYFDIPESFGNDSAYIPSNAFFQYSDYSKGLKIGNSLQFELKDIIYWSKNKEELEKVLKIRNYRLI